jgi:hypothetical protein
LVYCEKCGEEYRGKKRPKGNDNAYKCCSKVYPNAVCDNRGLNIPRLETFVIHYLQRRPMSGIVMKELSNLSSKPIDNKPDELLQKQKKLQGLNKNIKKLVSALNDERLEDIEEIKEDLISYQKVRKQLEREIDILIKIIAEETVSKENEKENLKTLNKLRNKLTPRINQDFDNIKKAVFELVDWISIYHTKLNPGGEFTVKIKLKNQRFADCYKTDHKLEKWDQVAYFVNGVNENKSSNIDPTLLSELSPLEIFSNLVKLSPVEARRNYNNCFMIKDKDLYKFD